MRALSPLLPITAAGGAAAFLLRLAQNRTGFEADTGLPVPGNVPGLALSALLVILAVALGVFVRALPRKTEETLLPCFGTEERAFFIAPLAGVFALGASGLFSCFSYFTGASPLRSTLVLGILSLLSAAGLFSLTAACRQQEEVEKRGPDPVFPAAGAVCCLLARLLIFYRAESVNPALSAYYVELLALSALIAAVYLLAAFSVGRGNSRLFAFAAAAAFVLCAAALADSRSAADLLFYAGGCALTMGFLLLRLRRANLHP